MNFATILRNVGLTIQTLLHILLMIFRFLFRVLAEFFGFVKLIITSILGDKKMCVVTGIFLIVLCGLVTYRVMLDECDFEAKMRMLLPCGIIVGVIALSTIAWTRE